jgi:hypothetical protein
MGDIGLFGYTLSVTPPWGEEPGAARGCHLELQSYRFNRLPCGRCTDCGGSSLMMTNFPVSLAFYRERSASSLAHHRQSMGFLIELESVQTKQLLRPSIQVLPCSEEVPLSQKGSVS